jgi:predicted membrane-bound dolichyl-phosphate-mannose-protein mannosyltransferase
LGLEVKNRIIRIYKWEYFWLCVIVIATLIMHFSIVTNPNSLILDEQHYVKDARSIVSTHVDQRPEHPPLAKLFIVAGIDIFGDNPFGWRVPSVIFGTIGIILFFFICRRLKMSPRATNLATFLFGLETMNFLHASIAMLDVFFVTLTLAFFLLYLYREYLLSGVFIGLAALAKLYAALGTPALFLHWIFSKTKPSKWFIATVIAAPLSFVVFMPLFDFALTHQFHSPLVRIKDMLSLSSSLMFSNVSHPALSRPWSWLLNFQPMAYWYNPRYTAAISPSIWGLIIPIVLFLIYRAVKRNEAGLFGFAWFLGTYLLWIPISIATNRVSFIFYFYPSVGALCLGLGMGLNEAIESVSSKRKRVKWPVLAGVTVILLLHIASFVIITPVFLRT